MARLHIENPDYRNYSQHATNRQLGLLREIMAAPRSTVGLFRLSTYSQVTVRSVRQRGWIEETKTALGPRSGVTVTLDGVQLVRSYDQANFLRRFASMNFAGNLDLRIPASLLEPPAKKNIHLVHRKRVA